MRNNLSTPEIECAVCAKLVDEITYYDDPATMYRVVSVRCHGQVETVRIPATVWMTFTPDDVRWGKAFVRKTIG